MEELNNYYVSVIDYENNKIVNMKDYYFSNNYIKVQENYIKQIQKYREELYKNDLAILVNEIEDKLNVDDVKEKILTDIVKYKKYDEIYYIEKLNENHLNTFNIYEIKIDEYVHWSYVYTSYSINVNLLKSVKLQQDTFYYDGGFFLDNKIKKNEKRVSFEDNNETIIKQKLMDELKLKLFSKKN